MVTNTVANIEVKYDNIKEITDFVSVVNEINKSRENDFLFLW